MNGLHKITFQSQSDKFYGLTFSEGASFAQQFGYHSGGQWFVFSEAIGPQIALAVTPSALADIMSGKLTKSAIAYRPILAGGATLAATLA